MLFSARSDAFILVGVLAGGCSGTLFLLNTSCSSGLPCQTWCWIVGSGLSAGGEKWSESAAGDVSFCPSGKSRSCTLTHVKKGNCNLYSI